MHTLNQQILPAEGGKNRTLEDRLERLQLRIWKEGDPERSAAEAFIRDRFQDSYAADVHVFMPYLLGITNKNNEISAVIGFRPADTEQLFLENYLDFPAEHALGEACGSRVDRRQIVKVGNLASSDSESFRILMIGLVTLLDRLPGTNWIMCTVGDRLFRLLHRTRFFPLVLQQVTRYAGFACYSASKFSLRGFSEALRCEIADTGIQVHYLAPRAVKTAFNEDSVNRMNEELGVAMDSPDVIPGAITRMLKRSQSEHFIGGPERFFVKLNGLFQRLVDRGLAGQLKTIQQHARLATGHGDPDNVQDTQTALKNQGDL